MEIGSADVCLLAQFTRDIRDYLRQELRQAYRDKDTIRKQTVGNRLQEVDLIRRRLELD